MRLFCITPSPPNTGLRFFSFLLSLRRLEKSRSITNKNGLNRLMSIIGHIIILAENSKFKFKKIQAFLDNTMD